MCGADKQRPVLESSRGRKSMSCKGCKSGNQRSFRSEMMIAFREPENVNQPPLYICQDIFVCLDCGLIELALPAEKLEQLKQKPLKSFSQRGSTHEHSGNS
jgi:hypothetical protein